MLFVDSSCLLYITGWWCLCCLVLVFYGKLICILLFLKTPLEHNSEMSLSDSGFEPGKKNFLQLTDKDGEQPQVASVSYTIFRKNVPYLLSMLNLHSLLKSTNVKRTKTKVL